MEKVFFNWSGGKDSAIALYKILQEKKYKIEYLLTSMSYENKRISMHGVPENLLEMQALSIGIPLRKIYIKKDASLETYNFEMEKEMEYAKSVGINTTVFGDIFLEDLRKYREDQLSKVQIKAIFPLWNIDTKHLVNEFVDKGFKAVLVSCNKRLLTDSFCGQIIDKTFIKSLPKNVDPCGENGEFHSFTFDGPIFKNPVKYNLGDKILHIYDGQGDFDREFYFQEIY